MVLGDIGGSGLSTGLTGRGMGFLAGEAFDMLIEAFEDIWCYRYLRRVTVNSKRRAVTATCAE